MTIIGLLPLKALTSLKEIERFTLEFKKRVTFKAFTLMSKEALLLFILFSYFLDFVFNGFIISYVLRFTNVRIYSSVHTISLTSSDLFGQN